MSARGLAICDAALFLSPLRRLGCSFRQRSTRAMLCPCAHMDACMQVAELEVWYVMERGGGHAVLAVLSVLCWAVL